MISIKSRLGCPHLAPNGPAVWLHIYHVRGSKTIQRLNSVSDLFGLGGTRKCRAHRLSETWLTPDTQFTNHFHGRHLSFRLRALRVRVGVWLDEGVL